MSRNFRVVTLNNESFDIFGNDETTILDLKTQIFEIKGEGYEPENVKLIHSGKILHNDKSVIDYPDFKFMDRHMVVIPNKGAKNTKKQAQSNSVVNSKNTSNSSKKDNSVLLTTKTTASPGVVETQDPEHESEYELNLKFLMELGFSEAKSKSALKLAQYDPTKAAELLLEQPLISKPNEPDSEKGRDYKNADTLCEFMKLPAAAGLKKAILMNPNAIVKFIMELQTIQPHLVSEAFSNPIKLLLFASDGSPPELDPEIVEQLSEYRHDTRIKLTESDKQAIMRIQGYGFGFGESVEAYLVCEKDETAALNFLLDMQKDGKQE